VFNRNQYVPLPLLRNLHILPLFTCAASVNYKLLLTVALLERPHASAAAGAHLI
jgi:hypothetical protein